MKKEIKRHEFHIPILDNSKDFCRWHDNHKIYHGSKSVQKGLLKGQTDTDYFNFLCPNCAGGQALRIIDCAYQTDEELQRYFAKGNEVLKEHKAKQRKSLVHLRFVLYCDECRFKDMVKVANLSIATNRHIFKNEWGIGDNTHYIYYKPHAEKQSLPMPDYMQSPVYEGGEPQLPSNSLKSIMPAIEDYDVSGVYFIQGEITGRIKIGFSNQIDKRIQTLQNSEPLRLIHVIPNALSDTESSLHKKFSHLRVLGEWFEGTEELIQYINSLKTDKITTALH